ncbi:MAG: hypothetical protein IAF94_11145 [Pirellulaceae bacterium]|nr:hypothetical protein [Pirellulaceae bacterium]
MKYSLRSLMIAVLLLPPLVALGWFGWRELWREAPEEIIIPYQFLSDANDSGTAEEWAEAIETHKDGNQ